MPAKRRTANLAPREEPRLFQRGAEPLRPLRVFVSYSSTDSAWCDWIAGSFAALKRDNLITIFRDRTLGVSKMNKSIVKEGILDEITSRGLI